MNENTPSPTLASTVAILRDTYYVLARLWPDLEVEEYRVTALDVLAEFGTRFVSVEAFTDQIVARFVKRRGMPNLVKLVVLARPRPFNVGGN